jgi:hypothetical protein
MANRIDFAKIRWGAFTRNLKDYQRRHPKSAPKTLGAFADKILARPDKFAPILRKRALFYRNIIKPKQAKRVSAKREAKRAKKSSSGKRVRSAKRVSAERVSSPKRIKRVKRVAA